VVIARQGQTYTVLTSQHVVADSKDGYYSVLSADGMTHPAHRKAVVALDIDLVQFESKTLYQVAALGDSMLYQPASTCMPQDFKLSLINHDAIEILVLGNERFG